MSLSRSKARKSRVLEVVFVLLLIACTALVLRPHFQKQAQEYAEREQRARVMVDTATEMAKDLAHIVPASFAIGLKNPYATAQEREWELAPVRIEHLSRKLLREPENLSYLNERANLYYDLGDAELYLGDLERILKLDPESAIWIHEARAYVWAETGEFDKALPEARKAVELDPSSISWNTLGFVFVGLGEYQQAKEAYDLANALEESVHALWGRAVALRCLGQTEAAEADFQRVRELQPDYCQHWDLEDDPGWHKKKS